MNKNDRLGLKTWVEIDKKAIENNYKTFRDLAGKTRLMTVIKSNAYGHGIVDMSHILEDLGIDWFGVDSVPEALTLRKEKITKPILVLGYTLPELFPLALSHNMSVAVSSFEGIEAIGELPAEIFPEGRKLKIHIKVDTGMHRHGFYIPDLQKVLEDLAVMGDRVEIEGVFSHLAGADEPKNDELSWKQIEGFEKVKKTVRDIGLDPIFHLVNTSGAISFQDLDNDMVRIGLGMYGIWPGGELEKKFSEKLVLKSVLSWKTVVAEVKDVKEGDLVGYGFTEEFKKDGKLAILPIGYWHGYGRDLSSRGEVLINGKRAKVMGRISMDITAVDVSNIENIKIGDEVTLVDSKILAEEIAEMSGTISYEILTRINPLIKRFYI